LPGRQRLRLFSCIATRCAVSSSVALILNLPSRAILRTTPSLPEFKVLGGEKTTINAFYILKLQTRRPVLFLFPSPPPPHPPFVAPDAT
jgi:hypothetical protein